MSDLTPEQVELLNAGRALIAHCPICAENHFLGALPMDAAEAGRKSRKAKCLNDVKHRLMLGPLKQNPRAG